MYGWSNLCLSQFPDSTQTEEDIHCEFIAGIDVVFELTHSLETMHFVGVFIWETAVDKVT